MDEALKVASLIARACGPVAVRQCLETLRSKQNQGLEVSTVGTRKVLPGIIPGGMSPYFCTVYFCFEQESMRVESTAQAVTYATMDFLEGVVSIKEKRFPDFQGV